MSVKTDGTVNAEQKGFKHVHAVFFSSLTVEETKKFLDESTKRTKFLKITETSHHFHFSFLMNKKTKMKIQKKITTPKSTISFEKELFPFYHVIMVFSALKTGTIVNIFTKRNKSNEWNRIIWLNGAIVYFITALLYGSIFYWYWKVKQLDSPILLMLLLMILVISIVYWKTTEQFRYWIFGIKIPIIDLMKTTSIKAQMKKTGKNHFFHQTKSPSNK